MASVKNSGCREPQASRNNFKYGYNLQESLHLLQTLEVTGRETDPDRWPHQNCTTVSSRQLAGPRRDSLRPRNQRSFCTLQAGKGEPDQPHCPSNKSPSAPGSLGPYIGHRGLELWAEFETLALNVSGLVSLTTATGQGCQSRSPVLCCASS